MENLRETIAYKGHEIKTFYDVNAESPDHWGNDDIFIVYDHRQFDVRRKGFDPETIFQHIMETKTNQFEGYTVFPLYAYIHSGVALSLGNNSYPFTCNFDTSMSGFVLVNNEGGFTDINEAAKSMVSEWNEYLSGEVYGYDSGIHSCWGFYGEEGYKQMIEEAKNEIDCEIKHKALDHANQVKQWIKNKIALVYRKPLQLV